MFKGVIFILVFFLWHPEYADPFLLASYDVHPAENGFFAYQVNHLTGELHYFFADDNLDINREGYLHLDNNISHVLSETYGNKGVIAVNWGKTENYKKELIILDPLGGMETYHLDGLIFPEIEKMVVLENSFGFLGKMTSGRNFVQLIHIDANEAKPYIIDNGQIVVDIAGNEGHIDVLTANVRSSGFANVALSTYDEWGNELHAFKPKLLFMMTSGRLVKNSQARYHIIGSYRKYLNEEFGGIYSLEIGQNNQQYFRAFPPADLVRGSNVKRKKIREGLKAGFDIIEVIEQDLNITVVSIAGLKNYDEGPAADLKPILFHIVRINDNIQEFFIHSIDQESLKQLYIDPQMFSKNAQVWLLDSSLSQKNKSPHIKNLHTQSFFSGFHISGNGINKALNYKILRLSGDEILVFGLKSDQVEKGMENFYLGKSNYSKPL